jgi:RNA polymerase sigma-70 factor, ECF subfamily
MTGSLLVDAQAETNDRLETRTDLALVAAINGGDAAAFEVLYLRHRDWVARLAFHFTGDADLALDVMQEAFLYFLKKFPGFRLTANLKTFLYPAVRNLSITARRKTTRHQTDEAAARHLENLAAPADIGAGHDDLRAVLANLSADHREVLLLRFVDGLSLAEIAAAMEIPVGTVKSRLHNALELLRQDPRIAEFFKP